MHFHFHMFSLLQLSCAPPKLLCCAGHVSRFRLCPVSFSSFASFGRWSLKNRSCTNIYNYIYIHLSINGFCTPSFLFKEIERNPRLPQLHDFYPGTAKLGWKQEHTKPHRLIINMPPEFLIGPFSCGSCKSRFVQVHLIVKGCSVGFWKSI